MTPESVPNERDTEFGTDSAPRSGDAFRNFPGDDATDSLVFFAGGLASSGTFLLARTLWPASIATLLALLVLVFAGAGPRRVQIGFARFCDGFGGGWNRERILAIMADASIGVFGAVGLALILLLHYTLFEGLAARYFDPVWQPAWMQLSIPVPFASQSSGPGDTAGLPLIVAAIPAAQSLSHAFAIALARTLPQISTPGSQSDNAPASARTLRLLFAWALAGSALAFAAIFGTVAALTAALALLALFPALRWLFLKRLSGATPELIDAARLLARGLYLLALLALAGEATL